jgi:uncharacterized protein YfdQ (DUF2303 family)
MNTTTDKKSLEIVTADAINEEVISYLLAARAKADEKNPYIILPRDKLTIVDIEKYQEAPKKIRKNLHFIEVDSFLEYFNEFKISNQPKIFSTVNDSGTNFLCIFDYDKAAKDDKKSEAPSWNSHTAKLTMAYHRDYANLRNHADKWISQEEFALFIEENAHLFVTPDAASMMELAQELKGNMNVQWQSGKRLSNGQVTMEYIETLDATSRRGHMDVPEYLDMLCPMYEGFDEKNIKAAFRWKIGGDKKVLFSFRLLTKVEERRAQEEVKEKLYIETQLPILMVTAFDTIAFDTKNLVG